MRIDSIGLPQDNGASDLQDSVRLAGIMVVFNWRDRPDLSKYILKAGTPIKLRDEPGDIEFRKDIVVRHPSEYKYDLSRDQWICWSAGTFFQTERIFDVSWDLVNGKDIFIGAVTGHIKRCQGKKANWIEDLCLEAEIRIHAKFTPLDEPNQLLCMMMVHPDKKYLKLWTQLNPQWRRSIQMYWALSYRSEPWLSIHIIGVIQLIVGEEC